MCFRRVQSVLCVILATWCVTAASSTYNFAIVDGSSPELRDFNYGLQAYMSFINELNPRGDGSTIGFEAIGAQQLASPGGLPQGLLGVVGGSFTDSATWMTSFASPLQPLWFPLGPHSDDLSSSFSFGLAPPLGSVFYTLLQDAARVQLLSHFGMVLDGSPVCAMLTSSSEAILAEGGFPALQVIASSGNVTADMTALVNLGCDAIISCASTNPTAAVELEALSVLGQLSIVFPLMTPSNLTLALADLTATTIPSGLVWVAQWIPSAPSTATEACAPYMTFWSDYVVAGCIAASLLNVVINAAGPVINTTNVGDAANRLSLIVPNSTGFSVGPYTASCRVTTTAISLTWDGSALVSASVGSPVPPCSVVTSPFIAPVVGIQLVLNTPESIAAADELFIGVAAYTANRDPLVQPAVYLQRSMVATPDGPLLYGALAAMQTPFGIGLLASVDISQSLVSSLGLLSIGRTESTLYQTESALQTYVALDVQPISLLRGDVMSAASVAHTSMGLGPQGSLLILVDDTTPSAWIDAVKEYAHLYASINQLTQIDVVVWTSSGSVTSVPSELALYSFAMPIGPPTPAFAAAICAVANNASTTTTILIPQIVGASQQFRSALEPCPSASFIVLLQDASPANAALLGLAWRSAQGYVLASLAGQVFRSGAVINQSSLAGSAGPNFPSALYHTDSYYVDDVSFNGLTSVPCAQVPPGTRCECNIATHTRNVVSISGTSVAQSFVFDECQLPTFVSEPVSSEYIAAIAVTIVLCILASASAVWINVLVKRKVAGVAAATIDKKLAKQVADEVSAILPTIHRYPHLFMVPVLLIYLVVLFAIAPVVYSAVAGRETLRSAEQAALTNALLALECASSFITFILPAVAGQGSAVALQTSVGTLCVPAFAANGVALPEAAYVSYALIEEKLLTGAPITASDATFGIDVIPLSTAIINQGLANASDYTALLVAAGAGVKVSLAFAQACDYGPLSNAVAYSQGATTTLAVMTNQEVDMYSDFVSAFSQLTAMVGSPVVNAPQTSAFVLSSSAWAVRNALACFAQSVQGGYLTNVTATCVAGALAANQMTPAEAVNVMCNWSSPITTELLYAVRVAANTPQQENYANFVVALWVITAFLFVTGFFSRRVALNIMQQSAVQFTDAVTRSKLLEANIAKYISVSMLDLLDISSVHDITPDPVLRDLTILHVEYGIKLYQARQRNEASVGIIASAAAQAVVNAVAASDGRLERISDEAIVVLFDHAGAALSCATRIEEAVSDALDHVRIKPHSEESDAENRSGAEGSSESTESTLKLFGRQVTNNDSAEGPNEKPSVCVALHHDTVASGFMAIGRYQFVGAYGPGMRTVRSLAKAGLSRGARIVVSGSTLETEEAKNEPLPATRQLGPVKALWMATSVMLHEICISRPRSRLDAYKPSTIHVAETISEAQQHCALDDYANAVDRLEQMARDVDVIDPLVAVKRKNIGDGGTLQSFDEIV